MSSTMEKQACSFQSILQTMNREMSCLTLRVCH
nr:MAG TPA: hypothetical protein [Bacteriophage sp.]